MSRMKQLGQGDIRLQPPGQMSRVLTAELLSRLADGQRELLVSERTIVTPLAADELKRRGITLIRRAEAASKESVGDANWSVVTEQEDSTIASLLGSLDRDGLSIRRSHLTAGAGTSRWAMAVASLAASGKCNGVVAITQSAGLCCCVANKLPGIRAVAIASAQQATQALGTVGANVLALETAGRTFFELKQILRCVAESGKTGCPAELASVLQELDGHAHR